MATAAEIDFATLMEPVARRLLGEPNKALSSRTELRWGSKGSLAVDLQKGTWYDHEAKDGGGALDLIMRQGRCDKRGALEWFEQQGLVEPRAEASRATTLRTFYDYRNPDGSIAYRVERRGKGAVPAFLQHGPDGRGGFHSGKGCMHGVPRLPYRLPELVAADPEQIVFIVEGEKDADRLAQEGLIATTNSGGAGKFGAELAQWFEGRRVAVLQDNDDAGRKHAQSVVEALEGIAAEIALLPPFPCVGEKGDVSDWFHHRNPALRGNAFELQNMAEEALARGDDTFALADLAVWARTAPSPKAFFMAPYVPREDVVIITGDGGTNKSTLALQISACSAAGRPMLGMEVASGPALYITAEDDDRENHWRLSKISAAIGTTLDQLVGRLYVVSLRGRLNNELATFDHEGKLRAAPAYKLLRSTIRQTGAKLVTLDNVAHLFAGNENDRGQVTAFVNLLYQLCGELRVTILLIAHRNKAGDTYSGSTAWLNAVRSQVLLERVDGADADLRKMSLGKANYARQGEQITFRWHDFALVRDEDLSPNVAAEIAASAAASAGNEAFLRCLTERNKQRRQVSEKPTAQNYAPKQFEGMPEAKGLNRKQLEQAMDRLFRVGAIERGFIYRDTAEGKDIHGLRLAEDPPETSPESVRKHLPETSDKPPITSGNTPPSTTYYGAAAGAAAPFQEEDQPRRHGGPILAPGESEDDEVPGWPN